MALEKSKHKSAKILRCVCETRFCCLAVLLLCCCCLCFNGGRTLKTPTHRHHTSYTTVPRSLSICLCACVRSLVRLCIWGFVFENLPTNCINCTNFQLQTGFIHRQQSGAVGKTVKLLWTPFFALSLKGNPSSNRNISVSNQFLSFTFSTLFNYTHTMLFVALLLLLLSLYLLLYI